jgi:hypothetical protein
MLSQDRPFQLHNHNQKCLCIRYSLSSACYLSSTGLLSWNYDIAQYSSSCYAGLTEVYQTAADTSILSPLGQEICLYMLSRVMHHYKSASWQRMRNVDMSGIRIFPSASNALLSRQKSSCKKAAARCHIGNDLRISQNRRDMPDHHQRETLSFLQKQIFSFRRCF